MTAPVSGLTIAAGALRGAERRMEVVANNLANVSTDGFKAERTFAHLLDAVQGAPAIHSRADFSQGDLRETGNPLDLALRGEGFSVVATPRGERWVRGGALSVDGQHRLTAGGMPVLGERGPIVLPAIYSQLTIQKDGLVLADGVAMGRMRVERAADPRTILDREAEGTVVPTASTTVPLAERDLRQGALEASNVEPVSTMVEMIGIQRHHALVERAIRVLDETRGTAASQLGKPV